MLPTLRDWYCTWHMVENQEMTVYIIISCYCLMTPGVQIQSDIQSWNEKSHGFSFLLFFFLFLFLFFSVLLFLPPTLSYFLLANFYRQVSHKVFWVCLYIAPSCWNGVPLKLSFPAEFMINMSIWNVIPFLVLPLFPSVFRSIKEKRELKWSRALQGTPGYKSPHFLLVEKAFSLLGLPWIPKSRLKQLLIR